MNNINAGTENYYRHIRRELIEGIPAGKHRILEVGCAEGATGEGLKKSGCASEVVGIEMSSEAAAIAAERLDEVICGDLEKMTFHESCFAENSFDYIICGDVLEHLNNPWLQLQRLFNFLKPGGKIIVSLPNIRYYEISFQLVFRDDWTYTESGILDSTHLRFFTKKTSVQMLSKAGLSDVTCLPLIQRRRDRIVQKGSFGLLAGLIAPQWVLTGTKA